MLMGLALSAAGVGGAAALQPPALIEGVLIVLAFAAWFVGACGMIGFVRWFFAAERLQAMRDRDESERQRK
jgi:hypothetical protein